MATVTKPLALDETLQRIADAVEDMAENQVEAVSTGANQNLTATQQQNARDNIGLGTYATKSGAAVVITADDTTPPADTSVLWVYPES